MLKKTSTHFCFLMPNGQEQVLPAAQAHALFDVQGFLRADTLEHSRSAGLSRVWYFNLDHAPHEVGWVYGMTPVLRAGRRATAEQPEQLPLLGSQQLGRFRCEAVHWFPAFPMHLPLEALSESLLADKTMEGLRSALVRRYAPASASGPQDAVLSKGLTLTLLVRA